MDLKDLLDTNAIVANLKVGGKKQALSELARRAGQLSGVNAREILASLLERERLGSTGVGMGVAIPHAKLAGIDRPIGLFARLDSPVDFDAVDDQPVDLIFVLLVPETAGADHLKALARVSRLFRQRKIGARLRGARGKDALYAVLTGSETDTAAPDTKQVASQSRAS